MGFYTEKEEEERKAYVPVIRKRILEDLETLKNYIEKNEPCPEKEQDVDMLVEISDYIESCLNNWHY